MRETRASLLRVIATGKRDTMALLRYDRTPTVPATGRSTSGAPSMRPYSAPTAEWRSWCSGWMRSHSDEPRSDPSRPPPGSGSTRADFDHMVRLGWVRSPQSIEVRFGISGAGAVGVALYTTASVDAVVPADPEVGSGTKG